MEVSKASERLKSFRKGLELTQVAIAERLGIPQRTYAAYETGRFPPQEVLEGLAAMGLNVDWYVTGEGEMWRASSGPREDSFAPAAIVAEKRLPYPITADTQGYVSFDVGDGSPQEYILPPMVSIHQQDDGRYRAIRTGPGYIAYDRDYWRRLYGFDPQGKVHTRMPSHTLDREFQVGDPITIEPLYWQKGDYLHFPHAVDAIKREGYFVLLVNGQLVWREVEMTENGLEAFSHRPGSHRITINAETRDRIFAVAQIVAGAPKLYKIDS